MKNIPSFLIGTASTMGIAESIGIQPDVLDAAQSLPLDSTEAMVSVVGGTVSTIVIALLKRLWTKKERKRDRKKRERGDKKE
ncbi:hypothetical protein DWB61_09700 [Ancylomarina euxinus]|uniref:Uncharacterized protein n=1 Tax=Ancylomarina euxinus TaxID=2283627 RepID=A0A425XXJ9_9BACT|nr:hypothetical protein [Ancylomarina euxinus]MCZ4693799.1 hypothetical protein [Ancylomarina euxinus]MCZ4694709.1 hypothetical protein [Ancylomarina euxinus]MUP15122.1 hypothetical protein [Ancylomarina euxinus]MUP16373.1 hypothetical protein [Ancylomarina euxinus]RRG19404.1 hypothetical protein DWB61_15255 [Ancylomarina euxinus]